MSLVKCKECGKELTKDLKSCPKCGYPIKNRTAKIIIMLLIVLILLSIIIFLSIFSCKFFAGKD